MLPEFVTSVTSLGNTRKPLWHKALAHKKILLPKQEKNSVEKKKNFYAPAVTFVRLRYINILLILIIYR